MKYQKKIKKENTGYTSPPMWSDYRSRAITAAQNAMLEVEQKMESKWGFGKLQKIVDPETAAKFERAYLSYQMACRGDDADLLIQKCKNLAIGYKVLESKAIEQGNKPEIDRVWYHTDQDGLKWAFIGSSDDAKLVEGVDTIYTWNEVCNIIKNWHEKGQIVFEVKKQFPGAEIKKIGNITDSKEEIDDEIPF